VTFPRFCKEREGYPTRSYQKNNNSHSLYNLVTNASQGVARLPSPVVWTAIFWIAWLRAQGEFDFLTGGQSGLTLGALGASRPRLWVFDLCVLRSRRSSWADSALRVVAQGDAAMVVAGKSGVFAELRYARSPRPSPRLRWGLRQNICAAPL